MSNLEENSHKNHTIIQIERDLEETTQILSDSINSLIIRKRNLEEVEKKSQDIITESNTMYKYSYTHMGPSRLIILMRFLLNILTCNYICYDIYTVWKD